MDPAEYINFQEGEREKHAHARSGDTTNMSATPGSDLLFRMTSNAAATASVVLVAKEQTSIMAKVKKMKFGWDDHRAVFLTSVYEGIAAYLLSIVWMGYAASAAYGPGFSAIAAGSSYAAISFVFHAATNPYISLARVIAQQLPAHYFLAHVIAQFIGVLLGSITIFYAGAKIPFGPVVPVVALVPWWSAFVYIIIGSYVVGLCVISTVYRKMKPSRALIVGIVIMGVYLFLGPFTHGGIDPFQALIPGFWAGFYASWIYYVANFIGFVTAGAVALIVKLDHLHLRKRDWSSEAREAWEKKHSHVQ